MTGYICPMHPDVIEAAPGRCPRCGMELVPGNPLGTANYRLRVETVPAVVKAGRKTRSPIPTLTPDSSWTRREAGVGVDLRLAQSALVASEDLDLPLHFVNAATGEPVSDLERYLGAFAHALIVDEALTEYAHAHPEETLEGTDIRSGGGPDVVFHTLFRVLRPGETFTGADRD